MNQTTATATLDDAHQPRLDWRPNTRPLWEIAYRLDDEILEAGPAGRLLPISLQGRRVSAWAWTWCRRLSEGVYVRASGEAESQTAAEVAAELFQPCTERLHYAAVEYVFWYGCHEHGDNKSSEWVCSHEGYGITIKHTHGSAGYQWERRAPGIQPIIRIVRGHDFPLHGNAPDLHSAMIGAIEAPGKLRRACARLLATATAGSDAAQEAA